MNEIVIDFEAGPVSQGANRKTKASLRELIQGKLQTFNFLLSGDVKIEILWTVHPIKRYESPNAIDMDNIIKPILDSMSGPNGILIDDTQVQEITSYWVDWENMESDKLTVTIKYIEDHLVLKDQLEFVHYGRGLCLPVPKPRYLDESKRTKESELKFKRMVINKAIKMWDNFQKSVDSGIAWTTAVAVLPQQRVFHSNKVKNNWNVSEPGERLKEIDAEISALTN